MYQNRKLGSMNEEYLQNQRRMVNNKEKSRKVKNPHCDYTYLKEIYDSYVQNLPNNSVSSHNLLKEREEEVIIEEKWSEEM